MNKGNPIIWMFVYIFILLLSLTFASQYKIEDLPIKMWNYNTDDYQCQLDPIHGRFKSFVECTKDSLKNRRRSGLDQSCGAKKLCLPDLYCDKTSRCSKKQFIGQLCNYDDMCIRGTYCDGGVCKEKHVVKRNQICGKGTGNRCGLGDVCITDIVTGTGTCQPEPIYRLSIEMTNRLLNITVNEVDMVTSMNPGLYAVGVNLKGDEVFDSYYNLEEESNVNNLNTLAERMGREFRNLYTSDTVLLILCIFQVAPDQIPNSVRDLVMQLGSKNIKYISRKNFALVVDMKNRRTHYDQIADVINYKHSITPYFHDKPRFLTGKMFPRNFSPVYGLFGSR